MMQILSIASLLLLAVAQLALAAGPRVDIVIGEKAPPLEKRAADDVAADLKKVYDAEMRIVTAAPEGGENLIFIGSPETNERTAKQIAADWPKLAKHGHVLRTIKYRGKPALFIGGGSPVAAYWAAAEYAHSLGIRTLLYGDLYPVTPKAFSLEAYDTLLKPRFDGSIWPYSDPFPTGFTAWSLNEQKLFLRQLARSKYSELDIAVHPWQPFVHFEIDGVKKKTGVLWYGWQFPVNGDTAGRAAFRGAKLFENPDFIGKATYEQRLVTGKEWMSGLIDEASSLGMTVTFSTSPMEFTKEFVSVLPAHARTSEPGDLVVQTINKDKPLERRPPKDFKGFSAEPLSRQENIHLDAYEKTYPKIFDIGMNGSATEITSDHYRGLVDDINLSNYHSSRDRFGTPVTDEVACRSFVNAICGEGVDGSVLKAHRQIVETRSITEKNDSQFCMPSPNMIVKHYASSDPPPEWWSQVRANYLGAMNDMYRANSRARAGGRSYTLYLARRCEFGYEYMNCVEATRKAGIAKSKQDTTEQRAQLEKAVESMNAACSALAAVARDPSDRGMIAVCNEFGYRPLQKELEKLDAEESK